MSYPPLACPTCGSITSLTVYTHCYASTDAFINDDGRRDWEPTETPLVSDKGDETFTCAHCSWEGTLDQLAVPTDEDDAPDDDTPHVAVVTGPDGRTVEVVGPFAGRAAARDYAHAVECIYGWADGERVRVIELLPY